MDFGICVTHVAAVVVGCSEGLLRGVVMGCGGAPFVSVCACW